MDLISHCLFLLLQVGDQVSEVEMGELPSAGSTYIALGPHQSSFKILSPLQSTCILCQEEQKISSSGKAMVLSAFVQQ